MKIEHQIAKLSYLINIRGDVNLNPAWQRGPVWSTAKQALLVDSILRGYDIPMIYLREYDANTTYRFEVVDGQQRIRSLWNFLDGKFALPDNFAKIGRREIGGKSFHDLPKFFQNRITSFPIVIAVVKDTRVPEISQLFSRMQMGIRLIPPELRNAVQTPLRHAIDATARTHQFFVNSRISAARFKYQDYLAHAFSICLHDARRDLKAPQLMDDYIHVTDNDVIFPILSEAHNILTFMDAVNLKTSKRLTQKWFFVDLFYLLYKNRNKLAELNVGEFAHAYETFDNSRLEYNADPSRLLVGKPKKANRDLYKYIQAFKVSGAEHKNLNLRNYVLSHHFKSVLEK